MSDSVISRDNFPQGIAIGAYACLFLTMCFFFASWLLVAAIPAIAFIVMLYRAGDDVSHDHAVYARNTLIFFAIALVASFIVLMAAILVIATSQADVAFMEQLEADMSAGNMSAQEFLSSVAGSGMFKKIAIAFAICIALLLAAAALHSRHSPCRLRAPGSRLQRCAPCCRGRNRHHLVRPGYLRVLTRGM